MKKTIGFIIFFIVLMLSTAQSVYADGEAEKKYMITEYPEGFRLSEYQDGILVDVTESDGIANLIEDLCGGEIIFDGVTTEGFEFPIGEYSIGGDLNLKGAVPISVSAGTVLDMNNMTVSVLPESTAYIRIKGGSVSMTDSFVYGSSGGAFVLDYATCTKLILTSCGIYSSSECPTVRIVNGSFSVCGGKIENSSAEAIENDGVLYLSASPRIKGVGYDIVTENPIHLSYADTPYVGDGFSVRFCKKLEQGTLTELFYSASEEHLDKVTAFDSVGKRLSISYFDSYKNFAERNFLAVYLPYTVKYYDGNSLLSEEFYLRDETVIVRQAPEKTGYTFIGWITEDGKNVESEYKIRDNEILYARYNLVSPVIEASSVNKIYDGKDTPIELDASHPLDSLGGFYTYRWYKDGEYLTSNSSFTVYSAADSGEYSCQVTFNYSADTVTVSTVSISVKIEKQSLTPPEIPAKYYTSERLFPDIAETAIYSFSTEGGVSAGVYPVTLTLVDSVNYRWQSSDSTEVVCDFEILKSENVWLNEISISDIYYGAELLPRAQSRFGIPGFLYSESADGEYSNTAPSSVGVYYVIACVDATDDYTALYSAPVKFEIVAQRAVGLFVSSLPLINEYRAFDKFISDGLEITVIYNSGREEKIDLSYISIAYQNGDAFSYGDNAVILTFDGCSLPLSVNVSKADYDISELLFDDFAVEYDGKYHTAAIPDIKIVGSDGIPLGFYISGGGSDSGVYTVTLSFKSDSRNYNLPDSMTATLTITSRQTAVLWGSNSFVYDGKPHAPLASFVDANGVTRTLSVIGSAVNAGDEYQAIATFNDGNYILTNTECGFAIAKADYDFSKIRWSSGKFVYDGCEKMVCISGLPSGVCVSGYVDGKATAAGKYTAVAILSYDEQNFNKPATMSYSWEIERAEYDTTLFSFLDSTYTYDGTEHYPELMGEMPIGLDGISLNYAFSIGAKDVSDGVVSVRISFLTDSPNYNVPNEQTATVTVEPMCVTIYWSLENYVYDGTFKCPTAVAQECGITVNGSAVNAGSYTAVALCDSTNFIPINPKIEFSIAKAENIWLSAPTVSDFYESATPSPVAQSLSGIPIFEYFRDPECYVKCDLPLSPGTYYMRASVLENENYLPLISSALSFDVIEVIATGITAELGSNALKAFETLTSDVVTLWVLYNDGSKQTVAYTDYSILYQSADSLRTADTAVKFLYGDFTYELPVTVNKADYDLSSTRWEYTDVVYDGTAKSPVLTGLPNGITVFQYPGGEQTVVGCYSVSAIIGYDSENYNPPVIPSCLFTIAPAIVELPILSPVEYSASEISPRIDSDLYTVLYAPRIRDAGIYSISVGLTDSINYVFSNGSHECKIDFIVRPRMVPVSVEDLNVYLWESPGEATFVISDGYVYDGDFLAVTQRIEDGMVVLSSNNPNYIFDGAIAKVNNLSTLSPEAMETVAIGAVLLIFVVLLAVVMVLYRHNLFSILVRISAKHDIQKNTPNHEAPKPSIPQSDAPTENTESKEDNGYISDDTSEPDEKTEPDENEPVSDCHDDVKSVNYDTLPKIVMDMEKADCLITDSLAKDLLKKGREVIYTGGTNKGIVNVDTLNDNFDRGERVDINILKNRRLIPYDTAYIKILARGIIDKPLHVYANDFSLSAIKMIALTGGESIKVVTARQKHNKS